jgi:hypothetical protein
LKSTFSTGGDFSSAIVREEMTSEIAKTAMANLNDMLPACPKFTTRQHTLAQVMSHGAPPANFPIYR